MCIRDRFLDCEFTSVATPRLISLALTSGSHEDEFYGELAMDSGRRRQSSKFTKHAVLPQLGQYGTAYADMQGIGAAIVDWLRKRSSPVDIAYDYHSDFDLLEAALVQADGGEELLRGLFPVHVAYLWGTSEAKAAADASWADSTATIGLSRHHALADARALSCAFKTIHG